MRRRIFWLLLGALAGVVGSALTERRLRRAFTRLSTDRIRRLADHPAKIAEQLRRLSGVWVHERRQVSDPTGLIPRPLGHDPSFRRRHRPVRPGT